MNHNPEDDRDDWEQCLHIDTLHSNDMERIKQAREAAEKEERIAAAKALVQRKPQ